jgi:hypothetical protein
MNSPHQVDCRSERDLMPSCANGYVLSIQENERIQHLLILSLDLLGRRLDWRTLSATSENDTGGGYDEAAGH